MLENRSLTALPGVRVGHWTHESARTGCTVILLPKGGAVASAEVRGGAPGTRETALLEPEKSVQGVHALLFSGGSAFGLAAATGVVDFLEAAGEGVQTPAGKIPIVPTAVIYDLAVGDASLRPDANSGLAACRAASSDPVQSGRLGAGTGAMVGKVFGVQAAQQGGLGNAAIRIGGITVAAMVVANATGDIVNESGQVVAGARKPDGSRPSRQESLERMMQTDQIAFLEHTNTTLVAVGTDAPLSKLECYRLAQAAQIGLARGTRPSHTPFDGDTAFAFSVAPVTPGMPPAPINALVAATQDVVMMALLEAVQTQDESRNRI
jgi:L-aminopeptidase/D-esterase-like protein